MCPPKGNDHHQDIYTLLGESIILFIVSFLPYRDAVRTSVLSKCWCNLWRQVEAVEFHERLSVNPDKPNSEVWKKERRDFIASADKTMANRSDGFHKFALSFSDPCDFISQINSILMFSPRHNINTLSLDFSNPTWHLSLHDANSYDTVYHLPSHIYSHSEIQSLKLFSCMFRISDLENFIALREISLGWIELEGNCLETMIANCPLLESLTLKCCYQIEGIDISGENLMLRKLILDGNDLLTDSIDITAPNLTCFKYNGLKGEITMWGEMHFLQEAELIFEQEKSFDDFETYLYDMVESLYSVLKLTMCSFVLQVLATLQFGLRSNMNVRHLTLRMGFYGHELLGVKYLLMHCPLIETLIINTTHPNILEDDVHPAGFWRKNWILEIKCFDRTLELVEVRDFTGANNELLFLCYVLRFGRRLRALNIYLSREGVDGVAQETYRQRAQSVHEFEKSSSIVVVSIH